MVAELEELHKGVLPIAATFSKDSRFYGKDFHPSCVTEGKGAYVKGDDGCWYLDWVSALGANLLGYGDEMFIQRILHQVPKGTGFSLPHELERRVAEKLVHVVGRLVPGWDPGGLGLRWGRTGTDATTMAVRVARAATGRKRIVTFRGQYHGWADWTISRTPPHWGIPEDPHVVELPWGDFEALGDDTLAPWTAAYIMEHPITDTPDGWYKSLRKRCDEVGALLILDEMVTWPRWGLGGAAWIYGIKPDIVCYGKALGNGIPVSCIVGRWEYFDFCFNRSDPVFVSSTHFGETLGLTAADAVLDLFGDNQVGHLWDIGRLLMDGLKDAGFQVIGHPPRSLLQFDSLAERGYFMLGMRDRSILINRPNLPNLAHTVTDVANTVQAAMEIKAEMERIDVAEVMRGREPEVLFASR